MCGFAGFWGYSGFLAVNAQETATRMGNAILHRGPDNAGIWCDDAVQIALVHRRLSILDLSPAGHQPMVSHAGRYVISFNGEIYNHMALRQELECRLISQHGWNGHSDTETLLAGFDAWGIEKTLNHAVGMFALAVWDRKTRELTLARDRLGEKPLYYGWQGQGSQKAFLFGSELSSLRCHPSFRAAINRDALALFMRHSCVGGVNSIYSGIHKLAPGHLLTLSTASSEPVLKEWWSAAKVAERGVTQPFQGSAEEAVSSLEILLRNAIGQQMVADVPLGAFLSGGIDSSTVVALMQIEAARPVKTFSIGFYEADYNEAVHAKAVALHLGTDHTELYVTPEKALSAIPYLPTLYSEPFADSSQIPTFLVSQLAKKYVTVSLSGDAGDELFCGYTRYQMTSNWWSKLSRLPRHLRQLIGVIVTAIPPTVFNQMSAFLRMARAGEKLHKGAALLSNQSVTDLYRGMVSHWSDSKNVVLGSNEPSSLSTDSLPRLDRLSDVEYMMLLDMLSYLPDDILTKVDRAAMGVSLETRVPFLDHRVVEFAWSIPIQYKLRQGVTKWPLRQILYRHVPQALIDRPKMGFGVPIDKWLRGPLREWAESLLSETRLRNEGFFQPDLIRRKWNEHLSGRRNWQDDLWNTLMFQAWLEHNRRN
ncbi:asparagine synthase (glutamine-hydrolyzing) [Thauera aminoaromatica]|uniref:asparagine synthase (glutamine-hydrolyzing) n=1 Tax=Thauera aminoaromatica TaxID=164330 RepID=A0A5C7S797_THASP|nr:asparagine synthase (glutamine-hydrolyzing) [Thauera aminoaromatica]TXH79734.1 MAG: asparagine synthase (glutamine-hydrolyzing) [Thauera aminoaromatica]